MFELQSILRAACECRENQSVLGGLDGEYFAQKFAGMVRAGIAHAIGLFTQDGRCTGSLGFMILEGMFKPEKQAIQVYWFTYPEARGRGVLLLREYERKARELGCVRMHMPHQLGRQDEDFGDFLKRFGFVGNEVRYFKSLADRSSRHSQLQ